MRRKIMKLIPDLGLTKEVAQKQGIIFNYSMESKRKRCDLQPTSGDAYYPWVG